VSHHSLYRSGVEKVRRSSKGFTYDPHRRKVSRVTLVRDLLEEIKHGSSPSARFYAELLVKVLLELEPKLKRTYERHLATERYLAELKANREAL
jgi:hypothetical protein